MIGHEDLPTRKTVGIGKVLAGATLAVVLAAGPALAQSGGGAGGGGAAGSAGGAGGGASTGAGAGTSGTSTPRIGTGSAAGSSANRAAPTQVPSVGNNPNAGAGQSTYPPRAGSDPSTR